MTTRKRSRFVAPQTVIPVAPAPIVQSPTFQEVSARLETIYAKVPSIDCKRLCAASCGIIVASAEEVIYLSDGVPVPIASKVTGGDLIVAIASHLGPDERHPDGGDWMMLQHDRKWRCPVLRAGLCGNHAHRPLICRLYGVVERLRCPYGCEPERWLTDEEAADLRDELAAGPSYADLTATISAEIGE